MKIIKTVREWRAELISGKTGFVPTMGALHEGHMSLVSQSLKENDVTVVSIYLNPTQFDNAGDLEAYPATWEADLVRLEKAGVDYLFAPDYAVIYPDDFHYIISEDLLSKQLCGAARPGHFDGVLTVVMKLLQIIRPARAYFGEKDYQQLTLIRGLCEAFFLDVRIVACPLIREASGLAMSSRNRRLSPDARSHTAPLLHRIMVSAGSLDEKKTRLEEAGFTIDYLEVQGGRLFAAVFLEEVRLIDNVAL